ncbi:hypothetical protein MRB53_021174 [Persea americana]|uniref:Uncharacterized protein n=1 Tax=Persea americana TaxID=3435 RepID=A0ACC2L2Z5_PERAE|nr:hypothetical protein MRB53_021174 [Persea americana]
MANGSHQILSFMTLVIYTILFLFTALLLKLTIRGSLELATSVVAQAQDPSEIRQDPGVLDADAHGPPHAEEEEEEEETGSFEMTVADPSMSSQDPTEIRVDPNSLDATAYGESEEKHFANYKSDWVRELRDPTERPVCAVRVGNRRSMKASYHERKALEMTMPTSNVTLESVWKRIMENSNECDTSDHPRSDLISIQRSSFSPFLNSPRPKKPLPRQPSPGRDELNRQVQGFINKFHEQMRQQRQDIDQSADSTTRQRSFAAIHPPPSSLPLALRDGSFAAIHPPQGSTLLLLNLVETVALTLKRIVASSSCSSEMLDELCKHGVIHHSNHLLALHSLMTVWQPTYMELFQMLARLASVSLVAIRTLF